jgi:hypothetical protein
MNVNNVKMFFCSRLSFSEKGISIPDSADVSIEASASIKGGKFFVPLNVLEVNEMAANYLCPQRIEMRICPM